MEERIPILTFKPNEEEYKFLERYNKLNSWSETCHNWIKEDMKNTIKNRVEKIRDGLILIFIGVIVATLAYIIMFINTLTFVFGTILFIFSSISFITGIATFWWELKDVEWKRG